MLPAPERLPIGGPPGLAHAAEDDGGERGDRAGEDGMQACGEEPKRDRGRGGAFEQMLQPAWSVSGPSVTTCRNEYVMTRSNRVGPLATTPRAKHSQSVGVGVPFGVLAACAPHSAPSGDATLPEMP